MTTLTDINELANNLLVERLTINDLELQYQAFIDANPQLVALTDQITEHKVQKEEIQQKLLTTMQEADLRSWKTEKCTISRAKRQTASINPAYRVSIEKKLKAGEIIDGWELSSTEYISLRFPKKQ